MFKVYQSKTKPDRYGVIEVAPPRKTYIVSSDCTITSPAGDSNFIENNGTFVHLASTLKEAESYVKMQILMDDL